MPNIDNNKYLVGRRLLSTPTSGDENTIYFIQTDDGGTNLNASKYTIKLWSDDKGWIELKGEVSSINNLIGNITLGWDSTNLKFTINDDEGSPQVSFSLDGVIYSTTDQNINGIKTFGKIPLVTENLGEDLTLYNEDHVVTIRQLKKVINSMVSGLKLIDTISDPNDLISFPEASANDYWIVNTTGILGGVTADEPQQIVQPGDWIIASTNSPAGTWDEVKDNYSLLQTNIDYATTTSPGFIRLATQAEFDLGNLDNVVVTPKQVIKAIDDLKDYVDNGISLINDALDNIHDELDLKLDKGNYIGDADDLKSEIDDRELISNKVDEINPTNKDSTTLYPSLKAVNDYIGDSIPPQIQSDWDEDDISSEAYIKNKPNFILYNSDLSLYIDPITNEIRGNIGSITQKYVAPTPGTQIITLAMTPARINYISVNGILLEDDVQQWNVNVADKTITILDELDINDRVSINYHYIVTE